MLAPLADTPLLPTGGVDATKAQAFLEAGAVAVGVKDAFGGQKFTWRVARATASKSSPGTATGSTPTYPAYPG